MMTKRQRDMQHFADYRLAPCAIAACNRKYDQVSYYTDGRKREFVSLTKIWVDPDRKRKPKQLVVEVTGMGKREMAIAVLEAL